MKQLALPVIDLAPPPPGLMDQPDASTYLPHAAYNLWCILQQVELRPDARCLDLGCGTGRMAFALLPMLDATQGGHYHGVDIHPKRIAWAREHLGGAYPNATFTFVDHQSPHFNPTGQPDAALTALPLPDGCFDVILAHSLFSHLLRPIALHTLEEVARLLRPGGWFYMTGYFWDAEAASQVASGHAPWAFPIVDGPLRYALPERPEAIVAVEMELLHATAARHGWKQVCLLRGTWRSGQSSGQDIAIWRAAAPAT